MNDVHATSLVRTLHEVALYPPHPPRKPSALYTRTHHKLVYQLDRPCLVCGVRQSTLKDPTQNIWGAKAMETHHRLIEDSLANAIDVDKFNAKILPSLLQKTGDQEKYGHPFTVDEMHEWIHGDERNLWVLCLSGETPVLMADGSERPIASININDRVIGHDGQSHRVTGVMSRAYSGTTVAIDGVRMTPNHPVLTPSGWQSAGALTTGEIVYEFGVLGSDMGGLTLVEHEVIRGVVGSVPVAVVDSLAIGKLTPKRLLHDPAVLHCRAPLASGFVPVRATHVSARSDSETSEAGMPWSRETIQSLQATRVRAKLPETTFDYRRLGRELPATNTASDSGSAALYVGASNAGAIAGTGGVLASVGRGKQEGAIAYEARLLDASGTVRACGRRRAVNDIHVESSSLIVYDIAVAGCRSFIAGGIAVHNCDTHHRHPLVGIHAITGPIWGVQDLLLDGFDLTGFHAYSPQEAAQLTALPTTTGQAESPKPNP